MGGKAVDVSKVAADVAIAADVVLSIAEAEAAEETLTSVVDIAGVAAGWTL